MKFLLLQKYNFIIILKLYSKKIKKIIYYNKKNFLFKIFKKTNILN